MSVQKMVIEGISRDELAKAIEHFERFGKTYFWSPPGNASGRRYEEQKNSKEWTFTVNGLPVFASVRVSCSCRNYYADRTVTVGGEDKKMMVPFLKKCLESL